MQILVLVLFSMLAFSSTSSSFFNQFKLARECGHWESLLNVTKQEAKPDIEYISSLNKKMNSLGCSKVMSWRKTNQNFMSYVERKEGCNHFGGEEPYDKARAEEIKKAVEKLKCSGLDSEIISFKNNKDYSQALNHLENLEELGGVP